MSLYRHHAMVEVPAGEHFPLDMLRYDACFPANSVSVNGMGYRVDETTIVHVAKFTATKTAQWTPERWESFGCKLIVGATVKA